MKTKVRNITILSVLAGILVLAFVLGTTGAVKPVLRKRRKP